MAMKYLRRMKYIILESDDSEKLEDKVNSFMEENNNTRIGGFGISDLGGRRFYQVVYFDQKDWLEE